MVSGGPIANNKFNLIDHPINSVYKQLDRKTAMIDQHILFCQASSG
jgi:hypothetical protein